MKISGNIFYTVFRSFLIVLFLLVFHQPCYAESGPDIPEPLEPWVDWVLYDQEEQIKCIPYYNNPDKFQCHWPTVSVIGQQDSYWI